MNLTWAYSRGASLGVIDFARERANWIVGPIDMTVTTVDSLSQLLAAAHGVIFHALSDEEFAVISKLKIPMIGYSGVAASTPYPRVLPDNVMVGKLGAEHLLEIGCRHFAFYGVQSHSYSNERAQGFVGAMQAVGQQVDIFGATKADFSTWLAALPKPVGIMACNDIRATSLLREANRLGFRIPEEVAVLGVDNDEFAVELQHPTLSSVDVNPRALGYRAATLLRDLMEGAAPPALPIRVPPTGVVARQSTDMLNIDDPDLAMAIRFIRTNCTRAISVDDVATELQVSRSWLDQKFKQCLHRTTGDVLRQARVEPIKRLLLDVDLGMAEIARRTGFSSPQQMSRTFAAVVNLTPTEYRSKLAGK